MMKLFIKELRNNAGLSQGALGELCGGWDQARISNYEKGKRPPNINDLEAMANALKIDVWMLFINPDKDLAENNQNEKNTLNLPDLIKIPVIDYIVAGQWGEITDPYEMGEGHEEVYSEVRQGNCFALQIDGHSMTAPPGVDDSFPHKTIVHIDPNAQAENGSFVAARQKDKERATFKQLRYNEGVPFLHALNPNPEYPDIFDEFDIIGVMYMSSKKY